MAKLSFTMLRPCVGASIVMRQEIEINFGFTMGSLLTSPRVIGSVVNVMGLSTGIGGLVSMGRGQDTLLAERELTCSVPTAMIPMSQNLNR